MTEKRAEITGIAETKEANEDKPAKEGTTNIKPIPTMFYNLDLNFDSDYYI